MMTLWFWGELSLSVNELKIFSICRSIDSHCVFLSFPSNDTCVKEHAGMTCCTTALTQRTPDIRWPWFPSPPSHFLSLCFLPSSSHPPPLHAPPRPFSEPLGIHDGGHMTKGAAPGHVCVATALPDTMTKTHVTWRRMPDDKNTPDICLVHLGDKTRHVSNGSAGCRSLRIPANPHKLKHRAFLFPERRGRWKRAAFSPSVVCRL